MSDIAKDSLNFLPPAVARLAQIAARPRIVAMGSILALSGLGWLYLGLAQAGSGSVFTLICRPGALASGVADAPVILGMWGAMMLAMMLPSAAPMILTYAEIADTAGRKRIAVVSPVVLAAGYLVVWLAFALVAAALQLVLGKTLAIDVASGALGRSMSAGLFVVAGLYQFSALKQACLRQCRSPFSFFFLNWKTTARGVFGLGVKQGLYCLGCCWAAMLLMFAVGTMNVVWMAVLGTAMTTEKLIASTRLSQGGGVILIAAGIGLMWGAGL
jgi:predicted metal-binding membrane protein